jgi:hypothetical protein
MIVYAELLEEFTKVLRELPSTFSKTARSVCKLNLRTCAHMHTNTHVTNEPIEIIFKSTIYSGSIKHKILRNKYCILYAKCAC